MRSTNALVASIRAIDVIEFLSTGLHAVAADVMAIYKVDLESLLAHVNELAGLEL
jgi:hypothetical protein